MASLPREDLAFLRQLLEAGVIKPVIDRVYPLAQVAEAHRYAEAMRYLGAGHAHGKVVITLDA